MFCPYLFCPSDNCETCLGSKRDDGPQCAHFPTDICSVIQEGEISVEKCTHQGASVGWEHHTLSLGRNKYGHNNSAPSRCCTVP